MAVPQAVPDPVVLVVDDEPMVLRLMQRALASGGYQVHAAADGLSALALASELPNPPAAVVTDLRMEPIDGASLARLVRTLWPGTRLLFVSGYGPPDDFGDLPGPLLPKPFDSQQLLAAVRGLLAPPGTSLRSSG
ncbi:MAG: response regulator [Gemmatimonadales bacterium]|nr:response regulator [Gemmatimonadales bacterium]